jgi:hypothetical protein
MEGHTNRGFAVQDEDRLQTHVSTESFATICGCNAYGQEWCYQNCLK